MNRFNDSEFRQATEDHNARLMGMRTRHEIDADLIPPTEFASRTAEFKVQRVAHEIASVHPLQSEHDHPESLAA